MPCGRFGGGGGMCPFCPPLGPALKLFIHTSLSCAQIRKLSVHNHKTHVVQINILTGHEKMCNLHFYSEDYFSL